MRSGSGRIHIDREVAPIGSDGSFEITGEVSTPHLAIIRTDSSGGDAIWLEAGTYTVDCRETTLPGIKALLFRTTITDGPKDAELFGDFQSKIAYNTDLKKKKLVVDYMDSLFEYFPNAGSLGSILMEAHYNLSDSATEKYIDRLAPAMRDDVDIKMLEGELKRNIKINTEKSFEAFSMGKANGEVFQLSSLKGKKGVILDFWASDCAPCRAAHPGLIDLYKKYNDKGLEIVSISLDSERDPWLAAIAKDGIASWINVSELKGFQTSLATDYFISFIPFHFLLDGDGNIVKVYPAGRVSEKDVEEVLNK